MIHCLFLISRQGKTRLTKWFSQSFTNKEKTRYLKEVMRRYQIETFRHNLHKIIISLPGLICLLICFCVVVLCGVFCRSILLSSQEAADCVTSLNGTNIRLSTRGNIKIALRCSRPILSTDEFGIFLFLRYASLYFITIVDKEENELGILEIIHHYVEVLDKYFGNVCELDLIFNFHKVRFKKSLL